MVDITVFNKPGLYIEIDKNPLIILTTKSIEETTINYWKNPQKITPDIKKEPAFKKCPACPLKDTNKLCAAIQPILPVLEITNRYKSFSEITAHYREHDENLLHTSKTSIQNVFQYIALISLMNFCGIGKKYWKYYLGIVPLMGSDKIVSKMYLNIFWLNNGDLNKINKDVEHFYKEILDVARRQIKRLKLIVKSDVIPNSYVIIPSIINLLHIRKDQFLRDSLEKHEKVNFNIASNSF